MFIMKKLFLITFAFFWYATQAQDKIVFSYDAAGNQIQRVLVLCNPCYTLVHKSSTKLQPEDFQKFTPEDDISYYPNPVQQELFLKWDLVNDKKVTTIQVVSVTGIVLKTFSSLEAASEQIINFLEYPTGNYFLEMMYTNDEKKSIQIIKK